MKTSDYVYSYNASKGKMYGRYDVKKPLNEDDLKYWDSIVVEWHSKFTPNKRGETTYKHIGNNRIKILNTMGNDDAMDIKNAIANLNKHIIYHNVSLISYDKITGEKQMDKIEEKLKGKKILSSKKVKKTQKK